MLGPRVNLFDMQSELFSATWGHKVATYIMSVLRNPTLKLNFSQEVSQAVSLLVILRKWSLKHWRHQTCSTYSCMPATHSLMTEYLFGSHKIYDFLKYLIGSHKNLTVCRQRIKRSVLSTNQNTSSLLKCLFQ